VARKQPFKKSEVKRWCKDEGAESTLLDFLEALKSE